MDVIKVEWMELSRKGKPLPILLIDSVGVGLKKYFTKFHDGKTRINNYRQAFGGRGFPIREWNTFVEMYKNNEEKIIPWMQLWLSKFIKWKKFSEKVNKMNLKNKSNSEIKKLFERYFDLSVQCCTFAYDYKTLSDYYVEEIIDFLKKKTNNPKKINSFLQTVLSLSKPVEMHKEIINLLEIAIKAKKGMKKEEVEKELEKHTKKYAFFGMYIYRGEPLTKKDFKVKLEKLMKKSVLKLEKELKEQKNRFRENKRKTKELIKELRLSKKEKKKVENIRFALDLSMACDELYTYIPFKIRPLLIEISRRFSVSFNQIIEMQGKEILSLFNKPLSEKKLNNINARFEDHALVYKKGKTKVLVGKELQEYSKSYLEELKKIQESIEIQGETAFPGKTKGKVKLIRGVHDLPSFKKGFVLVTGVTLPQYVPAMKKAKAIITDEGGMLSHAAIMSREFKLPCVIGTKIATRALKNNELIEVNATEGIIKRLKK